MTKKTLAALRASIRHWELMRDDPHGPERPTGDMCALCNLFLDKECAGCPVAQRAGHLMCKGTPYHYAHWLFYTIPLPDADWRRAAQAEIKFLKSLLPKQRK